jgi:tRNA (cytosine34-C5)-methyltransferase
MRLVPHDQDMGGFFATLLRKVKPIPGPPGGRRENTETENTETEAREDDKDAPSSKNKARMTEPTRKTHAYVSAREDVLASLNKTWGTDMADSCLFARDESPTPATLTYFSPGAKAQALNAPGASRVKCVWGGARVFERRGAGVGEWKARKPVGGGSKSSETDARMTPASFVSLYRLTQDGAAVLARARVASGTANPDLTGDRFVPMPTRDVEKLLSSFGSDVPFKHLTPGSRRACEALSPGSIVCVLKGGGADVDACPPLAVERAEDDALRLEWRYRRGLEGAPKAAAAAILRRLRENRDARG